LNAIARHVTEARQRAKQLVDLTCSNPTRAFEDYPHSLIAVALGEIKSFRYDPNPLGTPEARTAIQGYYASLGIAVDANSILLTASTSEAYALLFKLLCDPGDEVLVPGPSYPLFEYLAGLETVRVTHYRLEFDGAWFIDFDSLRNRITPRTRAIIIVNPNNPTGSFLKRNELTALLQLARDQGLPIISDEVFLNYALQPDAERVETLIGQDDVLSFSLNGLSKAAGMPQMKLGWMAVNGPRVERNEAMARLELIADTYLSVSTPVQQALPRLLQVGTDIRAAIFDRVRTNWSTLNRALESGAAHPLWCEGGWSAIIRLPATDTEENWTLRLLMEANVHVDPGYFFDMPSEPYIVVSLITPPSEFEAGVSRIRAAAMH
jgi:aspartate/methionine/tyrosine aminotransferase